MCMTWGEFKAKAEAAGVKDETLVTEICLFGDETELDITLENDAVSIEGVDDDDDFDDDDDDDDDDLDLDDEDE